MKITGKNDDCFTQNTPPPSFVVSHTTPLHAPHLSLSFDIHTTYLPLPIPPFQLLRRGTSLTPRSTSDMIPLVERLALKRVYRRPSPSSSSSASQKKQARLAAVTSLTPKPASAMINGGNFGQPVSPGREFTPSTKVSSVLLCCGDGGDMLLLLVVLMVGGDSSDGGGGDMLLLLMVLLLVML